MIWVTWMTVAAAEPPLEGVYEVAETSEALTAKHEKAVEAAIEMLPWAFRPFARPKLEGAVVTCSRLQLSLDAETFSSACDDRGALTLDRSDADPAFTGDNGKAYDLELVVAADRATLSFTGEEGGQRNTYVPQADRSLLVTKEIFSKWLPSPIAWTVRYRRR